MKIERAPGGASVIDVLDRVLDKGIVIDAWVRVSLVGIDLVTVEARVVVASIATYLQFSGPLGVSDVFTSAASAVRSLGVAASIKNTATTNGHWPGLGRDEGRQPATSPG
jgi:gas vesicle structural protein